MATLWEQRFASRCMFVCLACCRESQAESRRLRGKKWQHSFSLSRWSCAMMCECFADAVDRTKLSLRGRRRCQPRRSPVQHGVFALTKRLVDMPIASHSCQCFARLLICTFMAARCLRGKPTEEVQGLAPARVCEPPGCGVGVWRVRVETLLLMSLRFCADLRLAQDGFACNMAQSQAERRGGAPSGSLVATIAAASAQVIEQGVVFCSASLR